MTLRARPELDGNVLVVPIPDERAAEVLNVLDKARDGWLDMTIAPIKRIRSTGPGSQNHHINGHIAQLAEYTGIPFQGLKEWMKVESIGAGYPFVTLPGGQALGKSESDISTSEAAALIDTIHRYAAEWNIRLNEGDV